MLHLFIFLSLIGGIINTPLFQADINSYYAIILLKMDPRKRTLSEFLYYTLTRFIALLTALGFIASSLKLPIYLLGLLPCLMLATKFTFGYLSGRIPPAESDFLAGTAAFCPSDVIADRVAGRRSCPMFSGVSTSLCCFFASVRPNDPTRCLSL